MVKNWQNLCQKLDVTAEAAMNDLIDMDNNTTVVQEMTEDGNVSKILMERDRGLANNVEENIEEEDDDDVTLPLSDAANIVLSLHHFLITWKDIPDNMLESCNIVH